MKKLAILICVVGASFARAQQFPLGSLYYVNPLSINPAFTGYNPFLEAFVSHRSQFLGFKNGPKTNFLSVAGRFSNQHRLGLTVYSDAQALFNRNVFQGNYGYSLQLGASHQLVFGLGAGLSTLELDLSKGQGVNMNDPIYSSLRETKMGFNADFGVMYELKKLQVGISTPGLFNNTQTFELANNEKYTYRNVNHFRATAKYKFDFFDYNKLTLSPMTMLRLTKGAPVQYDLNVILDHLDWGWFALTYHNDMAIAASAGLRYQQWTIGYSHNFNIGDVSRLSRFSAEIILGYRFESKKNKGKKQDSLFDLSKKEENPEIKEETKTETVETKAPSEQELQTLNEEIERQRLEKIRVEDSIQQAKKLEEERLAMQEIERMARELKKGKEEPALEKSSEVEAKKEESSKAVEETKVESPVLEKKEEIKTEPSSETKIEEKKEEPIVQNESAIKTEEKKFETNVIPSNTTSNVSDTAQNNNVNNKNQFVFDVATNHALTNGELPAEGFYVILGAFADHKNTLKFIKMLETSGVKDIRVIVNKVKNLEQVCVYYADQVGPSKEILMKYRTEGRKSWILYLR